MNLLQIKQKMEELAISERYMAEACGVSEMYFKQIFNLTRPITNALMKKIEGVINTYQIGKAIATKKNEVKAKELNEKVKELKEKRESLKISWKELAENTEKGYNWESIWQVLTGKRNMSEKFEKQIRDAFDKIEMKRSEKFIDDDNKEEPKEEFKVEKLPELVSVKVIEKKDEDSKELIRGRIIGIKKARMVVKEVISNEALVRKELIDVLFKLDNELDLLVDSILAEV